MLRKYPFNYAARYGYLSDAQIHWEAASLKDLHMSYVKVILERKVVQQTLNTATSKRSLPILA